MRRIRANGTVSFAGKGVYLGWNGTGWSRKAVEGVAGMRLVKRRVPRVKAGHIHQKRRGGGRGSHTSTSVKE